MKKFILSLLVALSLSAGPAVADEKPVPSDPSKVQPLEAGNVVPDTVTVRTVDGAQVNLFEQLRKQPSVLIFYRGGW